MEILVLPAVLVYDVTEMWLQRRSL